ncbi:MAG: F0F1 ATP synthase subunit A, partial [Desulfobacterales bacterium]
QPICFMIPLNVIGELAKNVSISFRLFGKIMGGSIIILVVSYLTYSLVLPPVLNAFFGLFVGTIQAFVFTMLTVVYISVQVK